MGPALGRDCCPLVIVVAGGAVRLMSASGKAGLQLPSSIGPAGLATYRSADKQRAVQEVSKPGRAFDLPVHPRSGRSEQSDGETRAPSA
jgi:hypothetical protein